VKVTRKDPLTGKENTLDLPITEAQLNQWRTGGRLIQDVMRHLTDDQREFLMTGLMPESWNEIFEDTENACNGEEPAF
jgi:hypothetical protein